MKTWKIPVVWQEMGTVYIVANTLQQDRHGKYAKGKVGGF